MKLDMIINITHYKVTFALWQIMDAFPTLTETLLLAFCRMLFEELRDPFPIVHAGPLCPPVWSRRWGGTGTRLSGHWGDVFYSYVLLFWMRIECAFAVLLTVVRSSVLCVCKMYVIWIPEKSVWARFSSYTLWLASFVLMKLMSCFPLLHGISFVSCHFCVFARLIFNRLDGSALLISMLRWLRICLVLLRRLFIFIQEGCCVELSCLQCCVVARSV